MLRDGHGRGDHRPKRRRARWRVSRRATSSRRG